MKTTVPTGVSFPVVARIVALTWVWLAYGVVTLIVVVVATVSPAAAVSEIVCAWFVLRLLSVMLAVPLAPAGVGMKSTTSEHVAPELSVAI